MTIGKPPFRANGFFEDLEDRKERDYLFDKIEASIHLSREEMEKKLISKKYTGECVLEYEGKERNGIIMSNATNGGMKIGVLREE